MANRERYISVDVETSGERVLVDHMLSIGACVIGETDKKFYTELAPFSRALYEGSVEPYQEESISIACRGLKSLCGYSKRVNQFNPDSNSFDPEKVLEEMGKRGQNHLRAMRDFAEWVKGVSKGYNPKLVTDIQPYDGAFIWAYFGLAENFTENPFGYKGISLTELYQGLTRNPNASLRDLGLNDTRNPPHNALEDAIFQAQLAEEVFKLFGDRNPLNKK